MMPKRPLPLSLEPALTPDIPRVRRNREADMNGRASQRLAIIGVPSGAGACGVGQERTPSAMRSAGLIDHLSRVGFDVTDLGDSEVRRVAPR